MATFEIGVGMSVGKVAYWHDIRKGEIPNNVDPKMINNNVIIVDKVQGRTIEEFINDEMQSSIDAYNEKQKRKDRQIKKKYMEWHLDNGLYTQNAKTKEDVKIAQEFVLSYGCHENLGKLYYESQNEEVRKLIYEQAVRLYTKWIEDFKHKYPHIEVAFATIHADEPNGTIHCHVTIYPRAEYDRGLPIQCCWSRALEQDGIEKIKDKDLAIEAGGFQLSRLYKEFRTHMEQDLIREEIPKYTIVKEKHGIKHLTKNAYTELMKELEQKAKAINFLEKEEQEINRIESLKSYDESKIKTVQVKTGGVFSKTEEMVQMPVDIFEHLRSTADTKKINRDTREKIEKQRQLFEKYLDFSMTPKEKELKQEVMELRKEVKEKTKQLEEAEIKISQKNKLIEKLEKIVDIAKEFIRNHGMTHLFCRFLEDKEIEKGYRER